MSTSQTNVTWYNVAYNGKLPAKTNMLSSIAGRMSLISKVWHSSDGVQNEMCLQLRLMGRICLDTEIRGNRRLSHYYANEF